MKLQIKILKYISIQKKYLIDEYVLKKGDLLIDNNEYLNPIIINKA